MSYLLPFQLSIIPQTAPHELVIDYSPQTPIQEDTSKTVCGCPKNG